MLPWSKFSVFDHKGNNVRTLRFYKASPGGNATILVLDPVPEGRRAEIARLLMDANHLQAEQVGFLDLAATPVRLDMMGGEFCGNACRAAAAVMAREGKGLQGSGVELCGDLSVSGVRRPVRLRVLSDSHECWVEMPLPEGFDGSTQGIAELAPGMGLVRLSGITHLCLDEELHPFAEDFAGAAAALRARFGLDAEAVGCIWYRTRPVCAIKPVVWVRSTGSTHCETGCGSGSLALALWLGRGQNLPMDLPVLQPSGSEIGVRVSPGGPAWIFGPVTLVARGEAFLHLD
jgi:diaminopimelate epimerase